MKRIRIHDLRHSHISLLIDMGFYAVAIVDRVEHESIEITYQYAHLFPSKQTEMAEREGVTEQLKAKNQMDNIRSKATEIVNHDVIYA